MDQNSIVEQIKLRINIVDIISQKTKLIRKGTSLFGICPFHKEKTPSFSVHEDKQIFHCFGCGKSGDVFQFVMDYEKVSFKEALEILANIAGITIPTYSKINVENNDLQILKINEFAANFFYNALFSNQAADARNYLVNRNISEDMWHKFKIGYAESTNALYTQLKNQNFSDKELSDSGIFSNNNRPKLSNRIIIPIINSKQKCVGFGGRTLIKSDDIPKYINSPETSVFKKRELLFGENFINKSLNSVIVTEGYFDVISMLDKGFENVVAPLGTAISENQILKLWKYAKEPIMSMDGDAAGLHSMYSAIDKILPLLDDSGRTINFIKLPENEDLDSLVNSNKNAIEKLISAPILMKDMVYEKILSGEVINSPEKITFIFKKARIELAKIKDNLLRKVYHNYIFTKISDSFLHLNSINYSKSKTKDEPYDKLKKTMKQPVKTTKEEILLSIVCLYPKILNDVFEQFATLNIDENLKTNIIETYSKFPEITSEVFIDKIKNLSYNALLDKVLNNAFCINFLSHTNDHAEIVKKWISIFDEISACCEPTNGKGMLKNWARIKNLKKNSYK